MKNHIFGAVLSLIGVTLTAHAAPQSPISAASNEFGYQLFQNVGMMELSNDPNQNVFISPLSASIALEMLLNGAGANSATQSQLAANLRVSGLSLSEINHGNKNLMSQLTSVPQTTTQKGHQQPQDEGSLKLMIANSAWSNSASFQFRGNYVHLLHTFYSATVRSLNFSDPASAGIINQWASDNTDKKIPQVIDGNSLADLEFVLMNATYFKANWAAKFSDKATKKENFTQGNGTVSKVDMMKDRRYGYREVNGYQVMELPYVGYRASMFVVLPKSTMNDALLDAAGPIATPFWSQLTTQQQEMATFSFPKLSFEYEVKLNAALAAMGITDMFSDRADFSALSASRTRVSMVKQNTFLKMDEIGTEAAAVTTIGVTAASAFLPPPKINVMTVDRPFLVSIVERETNTVLFMGAISNVK